MKSSQTGTAGSRKEAGASQINPQQPQYANTQNRSVSPSQAPSALANYTLPGVISYLTSEFTNLERFKIITNLEKSEMKYRIQQLTSELNSVRFVNEKQALRIKLLEEKLDHANHPPSGDKHGSEEDKAYETNEQPNSEGSGAEKPGSGTPIPETPASDEIGSDNVLLGPSAPQNNATSTSRSSPPPSDELSTQNDPLPGVRSENHRDNGDIHPTPSLNAKDAQIPHVDLEFLRNSRQKLNRSIREIVSLLEPPSGIDFLESHSGAATNSAFEDLLEDSKHFTFEPTQEERHQSNESVFARYTLGKDDLLTGQRISFEDAVKKPVETDLHQLNHQPWDHVRQQQPPTDESDTETVTMDEQDIIGILSNGSDTKKNE
ncbi:hypothetical protein JCM33374_g4633 [Metschnikowia sp. JCM 33374]|nr:hypothetical protein JCM33374_g4633 [Metschnikowia sp. JCM 33374]